MKRAAICFFVFWSLGFRPWHFTASITSDFTEYDDISDVTWTQSGSILTITAPALAQGWIYRNTDASVDSTVEIRGRTTTTGANTAILGIVANRQSDTQLYMCQMREDTNQVKSFIHNSGFTVISSASETINQNTWYRLKITTADNGGNKDVECFLDGSSSISGSTGTQYGSGEAGVYASPRSSSASGEVGWLAYDLSLGVTSIDPTLGRHSGGEAVSVVVTSAGDEMQLYFDANPATSVVSEPTTLITAITPENSNEPCDVIVGFGTAGSYEYAVTITNGWTYRLIGGLGTTGGGF